jgi:hypothetical protein
MLRRIAAELRSAFNSLPVLLLFTGSLDYRLVRDDGWPWWLPIVFTATAVGSGAFLGWRKARKRKR